MTKTKKLTITAVLAAVCIAVATVGVVLALRTDDGQGHIVAPKGLGVTLKRTRLVSNSLGDDGKLYMHTDRTEVDFTDLRDGNIFGLTSSSRVLPGSSYSADMAVSGGTADFGYWIDFDLAGGASALAEQLRVTVTVGGVESNYRLDETRSIGSEQNPVAVVAKDETSEFKIKVVFVDDRFQNDAAQGESIYFDVVIRAFQAV